MQLTDLIAGHTGALHKLAYEKTILLEQCENITKEMTGLTGVINALQYVSKQGVENGSI